MTPCAHCPCPAEGLTCPALASGHARYCQWCDPAHPDHNPAWCAQLMVIARREPEPTRNVASVPLRPYPDVSPDETPLLGDLIDSLARWIGADRAAKWVEERLGVPCGCPERREKLNAIHKAARRFINNKLRIANDSSKR
jgi:hypothetical protein